MQARMALTPNSLARRKPAERMRFARLNHSARPRSWRAFGPRAAFGGNLSLPWLPPSVVPPRRPGAVGSCAVAAIESATWARTPKHMRRRPERPEED